MVSADYVYNVILYILNQYQGGEPSPDEINLVVNQANKSHQQFLIGEYVKQQYGRPIANVEIGQNSHIYETLSPFILDLPISVNSAGLAVKPNDFQCAVNMATATNDNIRFVQKSEWTYWIKSVIDPIATNPIYTIDKTGLIFAPTNLGSAVFTYVQSSPDFIWNFDIVDDIPVYNSVGSVGLSWLDRDVFDVVAKALTFVGVNLQSAAVEQFAQGIKTGGQ